MKYYLVYGTSHYRHLEFERSYIRKGPSQLIRVVQLVQLVKWHLIKEGRGLVNSYEKKKLRDILQNSLGS